MVCASFVTFYCEIIDGRIDREMETSPLEYLDPRPCRRHVGSMILPTTTASQMVVFLSVFFFLRPTLNLMYTSISFSFGCFFYFIPLFPLGNIFCRLGRNGLRHLQRLLVGEETVPKEL